MCPDDIVTLLRVMDVQAPTSTPTYVNCQTQCLPKIRRIPISQKLKWITFKFFHSTSPTANLLKCEPQEYGLRLQQLVIMCLSRAHIKLPVASASRAIPSKAGDSHNTVDKHQTSL
jgi:hypothetical protein